MSDGEQGPSGLVAAERAGPSTPPSTLAKTYNTSKTSCTHATERARLSTPPSTSAKAYTTSKTSHTHATEGARLSTPPSTSAKAYTTSKTSRTHATERARLSTPPSTSAKAYTTLKTSRTHATERARLSTPPSTSAKAYTTSKTSRTHATERARLSSPSRLSTAAIHAVTTIPSTPTESSPIDIVVPGPSSSPPSTKTKSSTTMKCQTVTGLKTRGRTVPSSPPLSLITTQRAGYASPPSTSAICNTTTKLSHTPTVVNDKSPTKAKKQLVMVKVSPCNKLLQMLAGGKPVTNRVSDSTISSDDSDASDQIVISPSLLRSPNAQKPSRLFPLSSSSSSESEDAVEESTPRRSTKAQTSNREDAYSHLKVDALKSKVVSTGKTSSLRRGTSQSKNVEVAEIVLTMSEDGSSDTRSTRSKSKELYSVTGSTAKNPLALEADSESASAPYQLKKKPKLKLTRTKHSGYWLKRNRGMENPAVSTPSLLDSDTNDSLANMTVEHSSSRVPDTMSSGSQTKRKELKTKASQNYSDLDVYSYTSDNSDSQVLYKPRQKLKDKLTVTKNDNHLSWNHTETKEPTAETSPPSDSHFNDYSDNIATVKIGSHSSSSGGSDLLCKETLSERDVVAANISTRLDSDASGNGCSDGTQVSRMLRPKPKQDSVTMKHHGYQLRKGHIREEEPLPKTSLPSDSDNMNNCDNANNIDIQNSISSMVLDTILEDNKTGEVCGPRRSPRILQSTGTYSTSCGRTTKDGEYGEQESSKQVLDMPSKQRAPLKQDVSSRSPVKRQQSVGSKSLDESLPFTQLRRSIRIAIVANREINQQCSTERHQKQPPRRATKKPSETTSTTTTADITTNTQTEQMDAKPSDESHMLRTTRFVLGDLSESPSNDFKSSRKRLRFNTADSECNSNSTADLKRTVKRVRFSEPSESELSEVDDLLMNIANGTLATPQESQKGKTSSSVKNLERKTVNSTTGASETTDCLQLGGEVTICSNDSDSTTLQTKPGDSRKKNRRKGKEVALTPSNQLSKNADLEVSLPPPELLPGSPPVVESEEPLPSPQREQSSSGIHTVLSQVSKIFESVSQSREVKKVQLRKDQRRRNLTQKKGNVWTTKNVGSSEGRDSSSQSQVKQKRDRRTPVKRDSKDRIESATAPPVKRGRGSPASPINAANTSLKTYTIPKVSQKEKNKIEAVIEAVSRKREKVPPVDAQSSATKKRTSSANSHGKSHQQGSKGCMEPTSPHNCKVKYGGEQSSSAKQVTTSSIRLHRPSVSGKYCKSLTRDDCITRGSHEESRSNIRLEGSMQTSVAVNKSKLFDTVRLEDKENESCIPGACIGNSASSPFGSTVQTEDTADNSSLLMDEIDVVNFTPEYNDPSPDDDPVYKYLLLHSIRGESPFHTYTASGVYANDESDSSPKPYLSPEIGMMNQPSLSQRVSKSHHTASPLVSQSFCPMPNNWQQSCSETDRYYIINDEYEESQMQSQYNHAPVQRVARQMNSSDNESFVSGSSVGAPGLPMNRTMKLDNLNF